MYNFFSSQKSLQKKKEEENERQIAITYQKKKIKQNEKRLKSYEQKLKNTISKENNAPTKGTYKPILYVPRETLKIFNLGSEGLYFQHRCQKDRLKEIEKKNQIYDCIPFSLNYRHKYRDFSGEKGMVYKSVNSSSRVFEQVKQMRTNELESCWNNKVVNMSLHESFLREKHQSEHEKKETSKINVSKQILPELNLKRYPKTYDSIQSRTPFGLVSHVKSLYVKNPTMNPTSGTITPLKQVHHNSPMTNSRKVQFQSIHISKYCSDLKPSK